LSPYLFILCVEGLSSLLLQAERKGNITGVPITARGFQLSHLFFVDDSLLFCLANFAEWGKIQQLQHIYELASGQKLNTAKTSIFLSRNTRREFRDHISSIVGILATASYEKYLGLPALVGRSKNQTFAGIQGRVCQKLDGWKEKFLSQVGKKILIKSCHPSHPHV
jgi:hypothetical protein